MSESSNNKSLLCGSVTLSPFPPFSRILTNDFVLPVIRFLTRGFCRNGDSCEFSHDPTTGVQIPDNVCIFNLQAKCVNGSTCR